MGTFSKYRSYSCSGYCALKSSSLCFKTLLCTSLSPVFLPDSDMYIFFAMLCSAVPFFVLSFCLSLAAINLCFWSFLEQSRLTAVSLWVPSPLPVSQTTLQGKNSILTIITVEIGDLPPILSKIVKNRGRYQQLLSCTSWCQPFHPHNQNSFVSLGTKI